MTAPSATPTPLNTVDVAEGRRLYEAWQNADTVETDLAWRRWLNVQVSALLNSAENHNATIAERDALKAEVERLQKAVRGQAAWWALTATSRATRPQRMQSAIYSKCAAELLAALNGADDPGASELSILRSERDRAVEALTKTEAELRYAADGLDRFGWREDAYRLRNHADHLGRMFAAIQPKESEHG